MIPNITETWEQDITSKSRIVKGRVELFKGSTLSETFLPSGKLSSIKLEKTAVQGRFFGFAISQKATIEIIDKEENTEVAAGDQMKLYLGAEDANGVINYVENPPFYVESAIRDEVKKKITITAYDILSGASKHTINEVAITFPITIREYAAKVAGFLGCEVVWEFNNAETADILYTEETPPNLEGTEDLRSIIAAIAEATGTIAFVDYGENIVYKQLGKEAVAQIRKADYFSLSLGEEVILSEVTSATELGDNLTAYATKEVRGSEELRLENVSPVAHNVEVKLRSKNLIPHSYTNKTINGITYTVDKDGIVTANGTATGQAYFVLYQGFLPFGTYSLSGCPKGSGAIIYFANDDYSIYKTETGSGLVLSVTKQERYTIAISINNGTTVSNIVFKPQLELGATATEYTPFVDIENASTNLLPIDTYDKSKTINGITFTLNDDNSLYIKGTATADASFRYVSENTQDRKPIKKGTYTISGANGLNERDRIAIGVTGITEYYCYANDGKKTIEIAEDNTYYFKVTIMKDSTLDVVIYPTLVKGATAPITLTRCGKNLFDIGEEADYIKAYSSGITVDKDCQSITAPSMSDSTFYVLNTKQKYKSGTYTAQAIFSNGRNARYLIRLYNESGVELGTNDASISGMSYNSFYKGWFADGASLTFTIPDSVSYWHFGFVALGTGEKVTISNIQLEEGTTATEHEPFKEPVSYTPKADGTIEGVASISPTMFLKCNAAGAIIEAEYYLPTPRNGRAQYITNNPFIENRTDIPAIIEPLLKSFEGVALVPYNLKWRGNPQLEIGDCLEVIPQDNTPVKIYYLGETLHYTGGLVSTSEWKDAEAKKTATNPSNLGKAINETFAKVDKIGKQIDIVASESKANSSTLGALEINVNSISATVEKVEQDIESGLGAVNGELATLTSKVEAQLTAEDLKVEIQKELENGVDKVTTSTGFTFNETGLTVSKTDSEISTTITEDGMKVKKNNQEVLTANNQGVKAIDLSASTYLIIGKNSRFEDYGRGRTGCFWIGGGASPIVGGYNLTFTASVMSMTSNGVGWTLAIDNSTVINSRDTIGSHYEGTATYTGINSAVLTLSGISSQYTLTITANGVNRTITQANFEEGSVDLLEGVSEGDTVNVEFSFNVYD